MKTKIAITFLISLMMVLIMMPFVVLGKEKISLPEEFLTEISMTGVTEGTGTYFEIKDSEYLNISLKSSEEIKVLLESISKMISLDIEAVNNIDFTELTLEGLEPNKTYYKYQDSYKNKAVFVSDEKGSYIWKQDLSENHHIWIQEAPNVISKDFFSFQGFSTQTQDAVFFPEQCSDYGTWNETTSTCILTQDLTQSVEITQNNITLDCNNHSIIGPGTGYGIYLNNKEDVTLKNCNINSYFRGINLYRSANNVFTDNTVSDNFYGIYLTYSHNNTFTGNTISNNGSNGVTFVCSHYNTFADNTISNNSSNGIVLYHSDSNTIIGNNVNNHGIVGIYLSHHNNNNTFVDNTISNNFYGTYLLYSSDNQIRNNNFIDNKYQVYVYSDSLNNLFDNGYPDGGNYWSDYTGIDSDKDGIGDTPYIFNGGQDNYPFMAENGWEGPEPINVAVILAETNDVPRESSSITEQPCKLLLEKTYPNGRNKEYYEDLVYCVNSYHRENSFGSIKLNFTIYDNDGEWFKLDESESYYANHNEELVKDAEALTGIDPGLPEGEKIIIVVHSGIASQEILIPIGKIPSRTWWKGNEIIVAEEDLVGTWAHEIGHVLGVKLTPQNTTVSDLYNMGNMTLVKIGDIVLYNRGAWDLMATGSDNEDGNNPPYMSSYTKEFLGWLNYDIYPKSAYGEYWINSLETSQLGDDVFRYNLSDDTNDESSKYYILEARNRTLKTWDSSLPKEKALVLYKVDNRGYPEYGYSYDSNNEIIMPYNQYRKINIPYYDGILTPDGDSHLDMLNLLYISALSDEQIDETYRIKVEIEKVGFDFFEDRFRGIVLEPSSQFYDKVIQYLPFQSLSQELSQIDSKQLSFQENKVDESSFEQKKLTKLEKSTLFFKNLKHLFGLKSVIFNYEYDKAAIEDGGPIGILSSRVEGVLIIIEKSIFLAFIILLINLLIILVNKKIIPNWVSERKKKLTKNILRVIQVISLVIFVIVFVLLAIVLTTFFIRASTNNNSDTALNNNLKVTPNNDSKIVSVSPLKQITLPDLDLHLYTDDGRHIGMNYETGEYEIQIEGAIVSGDNQDMPEWIFIPEGVTNYHFVVSSYDNQKFLEENPEIAQKIEDVTDNYEIYARYIDPETDIYTSNIISEEIDPGKTLEQPIAGTTDISVLPAIPWIISPKELKQEVIQELEQSKTGNKRTDRDIDKIIKHINNSLKDKFWQDDFYLNYPSGMRVFIEEGIAIRKILRLKKKIVGFEELINKLIKADKILAEIALEKAKSISVRKSRFKKTTDIMIKRAEKWLNKAEYWSTKNKSDTAIIYYRISWINSQIAIKYGSK